MIAFFKELLNAISNAIMHQTIIAVPKYKSAIKVLIAIFKFNYRVHDFLKLISLKMLES